MIKQIVLAVLGWSAAAYGEKILTKREAIEARIKSVEATKFLSEQTQPVGVSDDTSVRGKVIYEKYCGMCHAKEPVIPIGAPTIGDKEAWGDRLDKQETELLASVIKGLNAMPARGTCMECSDSDLQKAIYYMLPKTAKEDN